jgi:hypothetical protein
MFQIDLLKGQGRPVKSEPWAIALVSAPSFVPFVALFVFLTWFLADGISIRTKTGRIEAIDAKVAQMADVKQKRDNAQAQIDATGKYVSDIATAMKSHLQWTDILADVAKSVPSSVVVYRLSASRERPVQRGDVKPAYKFTLVIGTYSDPGDAGGKSIQKFIDTIKASKTLGPRLESIKPISNQSGTFNKREVADVAIECIIKANQ